MDNLKERYLGMEVWEVRGDLSNNYSQLSRLEKIIAEAEKEHQAIENKVIWAKLKLAAETKPERKTKAEFTKTEMDVYEMLHRGLSGLALAKYRRKTAMGHHKAVRSYCRKSNPEKYMFLTPEGRKEPSFKILRTNVNYFLGEPL